MSYSWTCPFCKRATTITDSDEIASLVNCTHASAMGKAGLKVHFVICPNSECRQVTLTTTLFTLKTRNYDYVEDQPIAHWDLIPDSTAKVYSPEIVPPVVIEDYVEACKIKSLSPKASATLARRTLQGMIRDFWKIKKPREHKGQWTLWNEIQAIKDKLDLGMGVWKAIDAVRKVGNIGAHMEEDINVIVDVEPEEAEKLIWLIEFLIERWYIQRYEVQQQLAEVAQIARDKDDQKNGQEVIVEPSTDTAPEAALVP